MTKATTHLIFVISVVTTIAGQLLLKKAMLTQKPNWEPTQLVVTLVSLAMNPYLVAWVLSAGISAALWILVVSRLELSYAFPVSTAVSYTLILILSWLLFDEHMSVGRWLSITLMCAGIFLTHQS